MFLLISLWLVNKSEHSTKISMSKSWALVEPVFD